MSTTLRLQRLHVANLIIYHDLEMKILEKELEMATILSLQQLHAANIII